MAALQLSGISFDELTGDPGSPTEGLVWYNATTFQVKLYRNSATVVLIDKVAFDAHATSSANPHSTTLEQARSSGATLSGAINMGGYAINNVAAGSLTTDGAQRGWVLDQITQRLLGLDWQESVLSRSTTPPGSPVTGDRYLIVATATGAWAGKEKQIAQWNGTSWDYIVPNKGCTTDVESENIVYTYNGTSWSTFGNAVQHSALLGLTSGDDHTQYQLRSEKGAASGYAALQSNSAISDATHGSRGGDSLHVLSSSSSNGFQPQSNWTATTNPGVGNDTTQGYKPGSQWNNVTAGTAWICISNSTGAAVWQETTNVASVLPAKSGIKLNAAFSGNPKKATVTFTTPFSDALYSGQVTAVTTSNTQYIPVIETQLAGSFVINMGTNNISNLTQVNWHATKNGESS